MSLDRFHDCRACFECVRSGLDIELRVQGNQLKRVMMTRAIGGRAGSSINRAARAELIGAVLWLRPRRDSFRKSGCRGRNIPHEPMKLIVQSVVAAKFEVMHV